MFFVLNSIHKDKSFHCDVCNVCLDKRLEGKHKCRPDSGHDECCICLEVGENVLFFTKKTWLHVLPRQLCIWRIVKLVLLLNLHVKKCKCECNLFTHEAPKSLRARFSVSLRSRSNRNLEVLVFGERGKLEYPEKNLSEQGREPTTNSAHISKPGFDPGPHWWESSALTTAPPLLPEVDKGRGNKWPLGTKDPVVDMVEHQWCSTASSFRFL